MTRDELLAKIRGVLLDYSAPGQHTPSSRYMVELLGLAFDELNRPYLRGADGGVAMHRPYIDDEGLFAEHDQACAVCYASKAVYDCGTQVFGPCWGCQADGWTLARLASGKLRRRLAARLSRWTTADPARWARRKAWA